MWTLEYPSSVEYFVGNEESRKEVISWFRAWVRGTKPILLIGPSGVGKTSMVHTLAVQFGADLIELNASDKRNKILLSERIIPLLQNYSLIGKQFLLFLDEVDGLAGREDLGAVEFLSSALKVSTVPIILAANEINHVTKSLAKVCKVISFRSIPPRLILLYLNELLSKKNIDLSTGEKFSIVRMCSGDIRKLINDAQARASGYSATRDRNINIDIENAIDGFFSSSNLEQAKKLISSSNAVFRDRRFGISPEDRRKDLIYAFFSSIVTSKMDNESLATVLDELSKIDATLGRFLEKRNWNVLKYIIPLITFAVFPYTRNKQLRYKRYSIGFQQMGNIVMRGIGLKNTMKTLAEDFHTSNSKFGSFILPYVIQVLGKTLDSKTYTRNSFLDDRLAAPLDKEVDRLSPKIRD
jgi:replication factor C large subunit